MDKYIHNKSLSEYNLVSSPNSYPPHKFTEYKFYEYKNSENRIFQKSSPSLYHPKNCKLELMPSPFPYGCVCGHNLIYREHIEQISNKKQFGLNFVPKSPVVEIMLKC